MRFLVIFTFLLFTVTSSFSQEKATATRDLQDFDKLVIQGNFAVYIEMSEQNQAVAKSYNDDVDIDRLEFKYSGRTLNIRYRGSMIKEIPLDLKLYYNKPIETVEARRGAEIEIDNAGDFDAPVSYSSDAGGKILVKRIDAKNVKAKVTKGGSIRLTGNTDYFEPLVKAGGTIASVNLSTKNVVAKVSLGGEIICAPLETLDAKVVSGGTISYKGNPKVSQTIKLGGKIEQL